MLSGCTALVTGSTSGMGYSCAEYLLSKGCTVFITGSSKEKCEQACKQLVSERGDSEGDALSFAANLADESFESVHELSEFVKSKAKKLDFLVLNAGMVYTKTSSLEGKSRDLLFQVNFLSQIVLLSELGPALNEHSTVMFVNSALQFGGYQEYIEKLVFGKPFEPTKALDQLRAYGNSKLCMALFSEELSRRVAYKVISYIPGMVVTNLSLDDSQRKHFQKIDSAKVPWTLKNKFSSEQCAEYMFLALTGAEKTGSTLCPYRFPRFYNWIFGEKDSAAICFFRTFAVWINENFQKWNLASEPDAKLFQWQTHPLVQNTEFREKMYAKWLELCSIKSI